MRTAAVIGNIVLFGFTCFVLITDGPPVGTAYVIFAIWSLLTLLLSAAVISRRGAADERSGRKGLFLRIAAIIGNIVFFGFVCWALVDQYPHPKEEGVVAFVVLMISIPIINLGMLIHSSLNRSPFRHP
jgi:uncharacterized membrane protein YhaH (DUF805 family)